MPFVRFYIVHSLVCNISISITTFLLSSFLFLSVRFLCACVCYKKYMMIVQHTIQYYHPLEYLLLIHTFCHCRCRSSWLSSYSDYDFIMSVLLSSVLPLQHICTTRITRSESQCNTIHTVAPAWELFFIELILVFFPLLFLLLRSHTIFVTIRTQCVRLY